MSSKFKLCYAFFPNLGRLCQNLMHNKNDKSFEDVVHHLELEAERLEAAKFIESFVYVAKSNSHKGKCKNRINGPKFGVAGNMAPKKATTIKHKRGKIGRAHV